MIGFFSAKQLHDSHIESVYRIYGVRLSVSFLECAEIRLSKWFFVLTGISNWKKVALSSGSSELVIDHVSTLGTSLFVNHKWQMVKICWKSKSGKIYKPSDDFLCEDVRFWLEGLDIELLFRQLYGESILPFKTDVLDYDLIIGAIGVNLEVKLFVAESSLYELQSIADLLIEWFESFNSTNRQLSKKSGIVQNRLPEVSNKIIQFSIDLGESGSYFMNKLLIKLSSLRKIEKAILGDYN